MPGDDIRDNGRLETARLSGYTPIRCDSKKEYPTNVPSVVDRTKTKELCVTKDRVPLRGSAVRLAPALF